MKTAESEPSKSNKPKILKKTYFIGILSVADERRIRIRNPVIWISGSGSVPKCQGSTTLPKSKKTGLFRKTLPNMFEKFEKHAVAKE
jgi:hypothetical protein